MYNLTPILNENLPIDLYDGATDSGTVTAYLVYEKPHHDPHAEPVRLISRTMYADDTNAVELARGTRTKYPETGPIYVCREEWEVLGGELVDCVDSQIWEII